MFKGVNWTSLITTATEMFTGLDALMTNLEPLLGDVSVEDVWNSIAKSASGLLDMDDWEESAK